VVAAQRRLPSTWAPSSTMRAAPWAPEGGRCGSLRRPSPVRHGSILAFVQTRWRPFCNAARRCSPVASGRTRLP
jgi:hypothetical protein